MCPGMYTSPTLGSTAGKDLLTWKDSSAWQTGSDFLSWSGQAPISVQSGTLEASLGGFHLIG